MNVPHSLASVRAAQNSAYPLQLIKECRSALLLFGAGFYGANDGIHIHDAGIKHVTVVDTDYDRLEIMRGIYPRQWKFSVCDVWAYLKMLNVVYDLVSVDPPIALSDEVFDRLPEVCAVAKKVVVVGYARKGGLTENQVVLPSAPPGWRWVKVKLFRSAGAIWVILERE